MTADKQLKAYIDRVLRLKEEQDTIGDDIREIYAEAKAEGYDKTIMGKLVAHLRRELKQGAGAVAEAESIFDTYLHAYQRASGTPVAIAHTHEEKFDAETGEILEDINPRLVKQVVDGMQTEAGRAALIAAVDILIEQEEAEEFQAKASGDNGATGQAEKVPVDSMTGDASRSSRGDDTPAPNFQSDDDAFAEVKGSARLANADGVEPSSSDPIDPDEDREEDHSLDGNADAKAGGGHVNAQSEAAQRAGALVKPAPARKPLRPLCKRPDNCGGYGSTHCASCLRASKQAEVAA